MKCSDSIELISLYFDKELDKESQSLLLKHISECDNCKRELEEMKFLLDKLDTIPLLELPENFHNELMIKITDTNIVSLPESNKNKNKNTNNWKRYLGVAAAFLLLLVVGGSAGNLINRGTNDYYSAQSASDEYSTSRTSESSPQSTKEIEENGYALQGEAATAEVQNEEVAPLDTSSKLKNLTDASDGTIVDERKQIKTLNMNMDVKNFDSSINLMKENVKNYGGYVENFSSNVYYTDNATENSYREGNITFKIPRENYEDTKTMLNDMGIITNEYEQTEDITSQYVDTAGRLKMKRLEEERLLDILSKSQTVEDLIKVEERLSIVRTDIENDASTIKNWDKLVQYSTINVIIRESSDSKLGSIAPDFVDSIKNTFINSINSLVDFCQNIVLVVVRFAVPIVIAAILFVIIVIFIKRNKIKK